MVQRRAKYYQKLLSQQAALVSQPPARPNVSNPPPLWGLKFLLSTSGPAWWMQTGLEFCPHANPFLPYRRVPACLAGSYGIEPTAVRAQRPNTPRPEWLLRALLFFCASTLPEVLFHRGGITEGDDTLKSPRIQTFSSICNVHIFTASVRFAGKWQSNVGGKGSIWALEITKSASRCRSLNAG